MKIFKKNKIDQTLTSRTVPEVIDPKKADFRVRFFVRRHLAALEGYTVTSRKIHNSSDSSNFVIYISKSFITCLAQNRIIHHYN